MRGPPDSHPDLHRRLCIYHLRKWISPAAKIPMPHSKPMPMNYIFTISGFTQKFFAKHGNGSINIHRDMRKFANPQTEVHLLQWNHHPRAYARRVAKNWKPGSKIQLNVYSYGGGWWALEFLDELLQIAPHIRVDTVVMCDPVLRYPWSKFWLKWKALFHQILEVPDNVKRVCHFYQKLTEPGGDDILVCRDTEIAYSRRLDYPHVKIDNSPEYGAACLEEAKRLFGDPSD